MQDADETKQERNGEDSSHHSAGGKQRKPSRRRSSNRNETKPSRRRSSNRNEAKPSRRRSSNRNEADQGRKGQEASRGIVEAKKETKSSSLDEAGREAKSRAHKPSATASKSPSKSREQMDRDAKHRAKSSRSRSAADSNDSLSKSARDRDSKAKHRVRPNTKASAPGVVQEYNDDEDDRCRRNKESSTSTHTNTGAVPSSAGASPLCSPSRHTKAGVVQSSAGAGPLCLPSRHTKAGAAQSSAGAGPLCLPSRHTKAGAVSSSSSASRRMGEKMEADSKPPKEPEISLKPEPETTAVAGSLVEGDDAVIATAVDEDGVVQAKETPTIIPTTLTTPPAPVITSPPRKSFYGKGAFWIAVLFILAGAGVGIFFATQSNNETALPANGEAARPVPEETERPTTSPSFFPSAFPSSTPTETLIYEPPSEEDCVAVSNGDDLVGQEDFNLQTFNIPMDVVLSGPVDSEIVRVELQERIQEMLMPNLIGCFFDTRRVRGRQLVSSPYTVANGKVLVQARPDTPCTRSTEPNCLNVSVKLDMYVRGSERPFDLISLIVQVLGPEALLVNKLSLQPPFLQIFIVMVASGTITLSPSSTPTVVSSENPTLFPTESPSTDPTTAPVTFPTTEEPTGSPTVAPTVLSTPEPTILPTPVPTTSSPTFAPVVDATPLPTPTPTFAPTKGPTLSPSKTSSVSPSIAQSGMPSSSPSVAESAAPSTTPPTFGPTHEPTEVASNSPTLAPSSNPSVNEPFGNQFTSSTYVMYHPNLPAGPSYVFGTREAAAAGCAAIGLDLCPKIAIENGDLCAAGWMTDSVGYWISNPRPGCRNSPGYVEWNREFAGAYCCGRPLYLPRNYTYIYDTREEARAACAEKGLVLCTVQQIVGGSTCAFGWLDTLWGLYNDGTYPSGCGSLGLNVGDTYDPAGAYCCASNQ
ncbi:unnamed protein product [Cylindrotheca closterium]|uniref:Uncharacterized protein n=1 Tax=Cylindrotheca closterium TaxID=2856 RepID=A0AAD2FV64_9STRA|nr:unnamed protein product [Cylindrotheca closterium]